MSQLRPRIHLLAREQVYSTPASLISHWTLPLISHRRAPFPPNPHPPWLFCIFFLLRIFSYKTERPCASFALRIFKIILASNISTLWVYFLVWVQIKYSNLLPFFTSLYMYVCRNNYVHCDGMRSCWEQWENDTKELLIHIDVQYTE